MKLPVLASLGLHALVILGLVVGLPRLAPSRVELAPPVPVELIDAAEVPQTKQQSEAQEPEPTPAPERKVEDNPQPKAAAAPAPKPKAAPPPEPAPPLPDKPVSDPQPPAVAPEPTAKPEIARAPAPASKPAPPEPEPEAKPEPEPEPAPQAASEPQPAPAPATKPEPSPAPEKPAADDNDAEVAKRFDALALVVDLAAKSEKRATIEPQPDSAAKSAAGQPLPPGEKVTASEISAVRQAVERHWTINAGAAAADDMVIDLQLRLTPDCMVSEVSVVDQRRYQRDPTFRAAADSAMRAVRLAQPLPLPMAKYDAWKTITLRFDPSRML